MENQKKVLVVDDEKALRDVMRLFLELENFIVFEAESGEAALSIFTKEQPDLVVLDIMLPGKNGYDVCREIRSKSQEVPIIFLTALKDDEHHILGYRVGGDDYIAKPSFKASILVMKVKRILDFQKRTRSKELRVGQISMLLDHHICMVDEENIQLTKTEFALLQKFMENVGRVFTRENLLCDIWGYDYPGGERVVDAMIKKLRKKLGPASKMLKTVVAVGYKMEEK